MQEPLSQNERNDIEELLRQYQNIKKGRSHVFLEEEAFSDIIDYYDDHDNLCEALTAANTGLEYFPFSSHLLIKKADLLIAFAQYERALDFLDQAALLNGNDINIYILKTDAFLALDQQEMAVVLLEEAISKFEGEEKLELLFELADVYEDYESFDKVFECLQLILTEDPNNEEALYKICFWTDCTGRYEESISLHKKITDDFPYNELAWFNLGAAFQGLKLFEKAIDAYKFALVIDEKFDYAYRNMGDAFIRLRKYKDAIETLEKVLELTRPEEVIYEAIGHCYHRIGKFPMARFNYRKASHLNPEASRLQYKIGLTYINEKQWLQALKPLENAISIKKNVPEFHLAIGECYLQLQRYRESIQHLGIVVRSKPHNIKGWETLIRCLFRAGYYEEAGHQCQMALKATNNKPIFMYMYAAVLFAEGNQKSGLVYLLEALDAAPKLVKKMVALNPSILQNSQVIDVLSRFKTRKKL